MHARRWRVTLKPFQPAGQEATLKACGVGVVMLPGYSWVPPSSTAHSVNVGTVATVPFTGQMMAGGKARCQLTRSMTGRSLRSSRRLGKPGTWRREAAGPPSEIRRPRAAGEHRRPSLLGLGSEDRNNIGYRPCHKTRCLRRVQGEPDAMRVACPVRRADRRNPPTER